VTKVKTDEKKAQREKVSLINARKFIVSQHASPLEGLISAQYESLKAQVAVRM
jgi:hypothetical protein